MKHYLLGIQLFFVGSLFCMENNPDHIFQEKLYTKYSSLKLQEIAKIPDIKLDAANSLYKELDSYYKPRLSAQQLPQSVEEDKVEKYILMKLCPEFNALFNVVPHHIIAHNVRNNQVRQEEAYSYEQEIEGAGLVKKFPSGHFKFMPKIVGLSADLFNGERDKSGFMHEEELYVLHAHAISPAKTVYALTSSKIQDNSIADRSEMNVWTMNPNAFVKKIQHIRGIRNAILSSDGQWVVTNSLSGPNGKLILTHLGDNENDPYLSDTDLVSGFNYTPSMCFNNSSTVLAIDSYGYPILFDLKTKKEIMRSRSLESGAHLKVLGLKFNHDDSRLIGCIGRRYTDEDKCVVTIVDTSNLADCKELQTIEIATKRSDYAEITFKHDDPNIVAISTDNTTMFFDAFSGKLLSKTAELSTSTGRDSYSHAGLVFMPCSSVACVGMNMSDGKSSCVHLYDYVSGDCIGKIPYQQPAMDGIGVTNNFRYLVTTFNRHMAVKTELIDDQQRAAFSKIVQKVNLVEFYALLQLQKAKQQKCSSNLSQPLLQYMQESFFDEKDEGQKLIKKYFF